MILNSKERQKDGLACRTVTRTQPVSTMVAGHEGVGNLDHMAARAAEPPDAVRLDKWLWAARWFKTRPVATEAIDGGKVHVNGVRVKRSKLIHVGDELRITKPPYEFTVEVTGLSEHRRSASLAQTLYREHEESVARRERLSEQMRHQPAITYEGKGRPTKKDRRRIDRLKHG